MKADWIQHSLEQFDAVAGERIHTIDMHTAGEPLRIVIAASSLPQGVDVLACRRDAQSGKWDRLRRVLMFEPRGHEDMYGAIIVPAVTEGAAFGVLFTHNEGYSTMCGHAIIALGKAAVELGWVEVVEPVTTIRIDAPAGLITAHARVVDGKVVATHFENVPSFVTALDRIVSVPGIGDVRYDIAYGGAYYAFVDAPSIGLALEPTNGREIASSGVAIKHAVMKAFPLKHPESKDLSFLYGTIFTGPARNSAKHSRHVCVFADGAIDRSPTGTGVSARLALLFARGLVVQGETIHIESITGESFMGRVTDAITHYGVQAIKSEVGGTASFTGKHTFLIEPSDALQDGFLIR
jgi:trans-L-3-hydroxyproline dehydratase